MSWPARYSTQLCEKAYFQYLVAAGNSTKFDQMETMDGEITLLCREYTISGYYPNAQTLAAIPEGTIIGPVLELHIVKILDGYGIEFAIPSIANPTYTSYAGISREAERSETKCSQNFKDQ